MLASVKPIAIVSVVWGIGLFAVVALLLCNELRRRFRHPLPTEFKRASRRDKRKLTRWVTGENVDVDSDLSRAYVRYVTSNLPLLRQWYRLFALWGVFTAGLGLLANPVAHPGLVLLFIPLIFSVVWSYRRSRQLERFVSRVSETG